SDFSFGTAVIPSDTRAAFGPVDVRVAQGTDDPEDDGLGNNGRESLRNAQLVEFPVFKQSRKRQVEVGRFRIRYGQLLLKSPQPGLAILVGRLYRGFHLQQLTDIVGIQDWLEKVKRQSLPIIHLDVTIQISKLLLERQQTQPHTTGQQQGQPADQKPKSRAFPNHISSTRIECQNFNGPPRRPFFRPTERRDSVLICSGGCAAAAAHGGAAAPPPPNKDTTCAAHCTRLAEQCSALQLKQTRSVSSSLSRPTRASVRQ